jgi:hypothetical protein
MKKFFWFLGIFMFVVIGVCLYFLNAVLPTGTGYTAKYICSQVFLAHRDPAVVFKEDVKPTHPLFGVVTFEVDRENKTVSARGFGFWKPMTALYREGCGCTLAVESSLEKLGNRLKASSPHKSPIWSACGRMGNWSVWMTSPAKLMRTNS